MRTQRGSLVRSAILLSVFLLLLGASGANATEGDAARAGNGEDYQAFVDLLNQGPGTDSSYCESGCCWASCGMSGGIASCSEGGCWAWCPDGSYAEYTCNAS
jgi:hypothetical protein